MSPLLNTNVAVYKAIAMEAYLKMRDHITAGRKPKSDGSAGWIVSFDPEQNSFKQAMITTVFAAMWLDALLHLLIVCHFGVMTFKKFDRKHSYEAGLLMLGCSDKEILNAVNRLQASRRELVHEKAHLDNGAIKTAEDEAANAYGLIQAIEKQFMIKPISGSAMDAETTSRLKAK